MVPDLVVSWQMKHKKEQGGHDRYNQVGSQISWKERDLSPENF